MAGFVWIMGGCMEIMAGFVLKMIKIYLMWVIIVFIGMVVVFIRATVKDCPYEKLFLFGVCIIICIKIMHGIIFRFLKKM